MSPRPVLAILCAHAYRPHLISPRLSSDPVGSGRPIVFSAGARA
jgi:hypothetical protein